MTATAPHTPDSRRSASSDNTRLWYGILGAAAIVILALGFILHESKESEAATQKAQQLTTAFRQAGLTVPASQKVFIRTLGDDGGAVCDNPASALGKATLADQITNGADFVGRRPVIIDRDLVVGELLILQTYCPEHLEKYRERIDDYKYDDTVEF